MLKIKIFRLFIGGLHGWGILSIAWWGSQEIKRQSFAVDDPFVGLGCIIERVDAFLLELPKGQPIKCFNYGVRRRKTGEKVIFSSCCGGESGIFYGRGLSCLLSTPYSEKTAFQRAFCWRTLWLKHFTDSLWGCPNYFPLARTALLYLWLQETKSQSFGLTTPSEYVSFMPVFPFLLQKQHNKCNSCIRESWGQGFDKVESLGRGKGRFGGGRGTFLQ